MSETVTETVTAAATETVQVDPVEVDPIKVIHTGETLSLSGRSTLEFSIGRHSKDGSLHLRILSSSGGGMVCRDWVAASKIDAAVIGEEAITGKALQMLQKGRSINFGPYCLGICIHLGLVRAARRETADRSYPGREPGDRDRAAQPRARIDEVVGTGAADGRPGDRHRCRPCGGDGHRCRRSDRGRARRRGSAPLWRHQHRARQGDGHGQPT